tara:strand:+ start:2056 stop:4389 length:2334 start_codon:yes stop_codon:yes gene_type:complete
MSLISRVIKSLINGISQQAPSVRLDNQVDDQINMIPDISGVLTKRSPVELDDIITQDGSRVYAEEHAMFTMTIDEEQVSIGIKPDGTVYRFDENFAATTISQAASVKTYLTHTNKDDISSVETSDSFILLNRGTTVALNTAIAESTSTYARSLIWVTSALVDATYIITHVADPVGAADPVRTLVGSHKAISTDTPKSIVTKLITGAATNMTTAIPGSKTFHQENNTVIVRNDDLDYFEVECDFGYHINTIAEAHPSNTKTLTDPTVLPSRVATGIDDVATVTGTDNFIVRINPSVNEDLTTYYLKYSDEYLAWVEVADLYIGSIDNTTMPVTITKSGVATITVAHSVFLAPLAGDNLSNPPPTIVGSKIKDMIIYNSRLGFASESTLVFSVIDDYYNLYRTTTSSSLIADVVDLELDSSKLGYKKIDNIFTLDNNIIINTGLTQSVLAIPQNLDISGAIFASVGAFDLGNAVPIPIRRSMYFPIKQGSFSTIKAFTPDVETGIGYTDNPITKHCEKLIKGTIIQSVFTNDIFIARTDATPKTLYIQHTYVSEGTLLQNAWHKWTFKYDIKYIYATGEDLKIVFEDTDNTQTIYGSLSLVPSEITEDTDTQIGYKPYLDYKTTDTVQAAKLSGTISVDTQIGKLVAIGAANSVQGNTYLSSVTLSEIIPKAQSADGSLTKIGYALLMLRRMSITLGYSGRFKVEVTRLRRTTYSHNFIPELLGNIVIGREPVSTRQAKFPVNGRSQDVTVTVTSEDTFTPIQIISLEWQGQLISQGGR